MTNRYYTFNQWIVALGMGGIVALVAYLLVQLGLVNFDLAIANRRVGSVEGQFVEAIHVGRDIKGLYLECMQQKERAQATLTRIEERCGAGGW